LLLDFDLVSLHIELLRVGYHLEDWLLADIIIDLGVSDSKL
jgi:hypothetical protein